MEQETLKECWERACRQTLNDISKTFLINAHKGSYNDEAVFLAVGQTIENFPIPEYKEIEK